MSTATSIQNTIKEWNDLTQQITTKIHTTEQPIFLPTSFIKSKLIPAILIVAICLSIVYTICLKFIVYNNDSGISTNKKSPTSTENGNSQRHQTSNNNHKEQQRSINKKKIKFCYQLTNIIFNIAIGSIGLYLEYVVMPTLDVFAEKSTSIDKIVGLENELYLVSAFQLGYQLWAIPVGIFHVKEDMTMILHHFAVVLSCGISGFFTIGFRYYTPFFYGVMELSSIPLAIMNSFRDNPSWQKRYPTINELSRITFVVSFLGIRTIMCFSRWPIYIRDSFLVFYTYNRPIIDIYKFYMFIQWLLATFLAILQLYWAALIIKGAVKHILPTNTNTNTTTGGKDEKQKSKTI